MQLSLSFYLQQDNWHAGLCFRTLVDLLTAGVDGRGALAGKLRAGDRAAKGGDSTLVKGSPLPPGLLGGAGSGGPTATGTVGRLAVALGADT